MFDILQEADDASIHSPPDSLINVNWQEPNDHISVRGGGGVGGPVEVVVLGQEGLKGAGESAREQSAGCGGV